MPSWHEDEELQVDPDDGSSGTQPEAQRSFYRECTSVFLWSLKSHVMK